MSEAENERDEVAKSGAQSVSLLPDLPTSKDAFGPHKQLANAIAEVVRTEQGGKAVALEGGWGSGKSSVVEMFRHELEGETPESSSTRVYVFDAWSHEGDPLRRVFLEELTEFSKPQFDADTQESWEKRKRTEISGRSRETNQTTVPILKSSLPLLSLVLLTLFPIAVAVVSGLVRQDLKDDVIQWSALSAGVIALLVPGFLLVLFLYCSWPFWPFTKFKCFESRIGKKKKREQAGRLISLYAKKTDETTKTTAHETLGPTSIEFQKYFSDLVKSYLDAPNRKLVVVLDNLDRVPPTTAKSLWTTLRVFAECCENQRNSAWASRVWFIVPYDPDAARRLWDDGEESTLVRRGTPEHGSSEGSDDSEAETKPIAPTAPRLSAAFLDKTFQVRFDVPPLLLADWKAFLESLLEKALGDSASDERAVHNVYLLSRRMAQKKRRPPTPRHLKLYVNDIGALHRRFQGKFPLDHLAVYAILRRQGHDVRLWLLEHRVEQEQYNAILGSDAYIESLCAMAYGTTDKGRAQDLLLRSPIEAALAEGDHEEMTKLASAHGFWQVLEMICNEPATEFGVEEPRVLNVVKAVENGNLLDGPEIERTALKEFMEELVSNAEWKPLDESNGQGAAIAFRLNLGDDALRSILERLSSFKESADIEKVEIESWLRGMQLIAQTVVDHLDSGSFRGQVKIPATEKCSGLLTALAKVDATARHNIAELLCFQGKVGDVVAPLLPQASAAWTDESYLALRSLLLIPDTTINTKAVLDALFGRLQVDEELNKKELDRLVATVANLEELYEGPVSERLKQFVSGGFSFRRIKNLEQSLVSATVSHLLRWSIHRHDFKTAPTTPTNAPEGFQLAKEIGASPKDYPTVIDGIVAHCTEKDPNQLLDSILHEVSHLNALVVEVLLRLRENNRLPLVLTASAIVSRITELKNACKSEELPSCNELCEELLSNDTFTASLTSVKIEENSLDGVIMLVRSSAMSKCAEFSQLITEFLKGRTAEQWKSSLQSSDSVCELLVAVREHDNRFTLSGAFTESFEAVLNDVLDGAVSLQSPPKLWEACRAAIAPHVQDTIAGRVIERADAPDKRLGDVIGLAPDCLQHAAVNHSEESFVRNTFLPLLKSKAVDRLEWMRRVSEERPKFWPNTPDSDRETFSQQLSEDYREASDDMKSVLEELAKALEINLEEEQTEHHDDVDPQ